MKQILLVWMVLLVSMMTYGANFYVDAVYGNDGWDGSSAAIPSSGTAGPKRTLAAIMGVGELTSGDMVYAAEGAYSDGEMTGYRVRIPAGVKLVASGSRDATIIVGQVASGVATEASPWGCGTGALRCVYVGAGAQLVGFTVSGGRAQAFTNTDDGRIGGVGGAGDGALLVGCHITDCVAGCDAGISDVNAIRCEFDLERCANDSIYMTRGKAYGCYFGDRAGNLDENASQNRYGLIEVVARNCKGGIGLKTGEVYNSHLAGINADVTYYRSYHYNLGEGSVDVDGSAKVSSGLVPVDANYRPNKGNTYLIDKGVYDYYTNGATVAEMAYLEQDLVGGQRVYGTAIDVGCGEYDPRADYTAIVGGNYAGRLTVSAISPGIVPTSSGTTIPSDGQLAITWNDAPIQAVNFGYSFTATVTGEATLSLYLDDAAVPFAAYTAADATVKPVYEASGTNTLRLVVTGSGSAAVSAWQATDFWYVNATHGSDTADGRSAEVISATKGPTLTLSRIMALIENVRTTSGKAQLAEIVYAAPGVYKDGSYGVHRFRLLTDVKLIASGTKEETVIEGQADLTDETGCGNGALGGGYLNARTLLRGFTVRNGHAQSYTGGSYGGLCGVDRETSLVYDCIITNNIGSIGGGVNNLTAIRCLIAENGAGYRSANAEQATLYNCLTYGERVTGRYVYGCYKCVLNACTVLDPTADAGTHTCTLYNSYNANERASSTFLYSAATVVPATTVLGEGAFQVKKEEMPLDANYAPVKGNRGIDKGSYSLYVRDAPANVLALLDLDYAGNPRVSNGEIDLGCCEYDAREDIAAKLRRTGVAVTVATPGVTIVEDGVRLSNGDQLELDCQVKKPGEGFSFSAQVTGAGALTILVDGAEMKPDGEGKYAFTCKTDVSHLVLTFTGAGHVVVSSFHSTNGLVMIVR